MRNRARVFSKRRRVAIKCKSTHQRGRSMIKHALACAALAVLSATAAHAQDIITPHITVQHLYIKYCTGRGREYAICAAYIGGVEDAMRQTGMLVSAMPADTPIAVRRALAPKAICAHVPNTRRNAIQAFKDWVPSNRKHWGESAYFGVATALASTWPCPVPK